MPGPFFSIFVIRIFCKSIPRRQDAEPAAGVVENCKELCSNTPAANPQHSDKVRHKSREKGKTGTASSGHILYIGRMFNSEKNRGFYANHTLKISTLFKVKGNKYMSLSRSCFVWGIGVEEFCVSDIFVIFQRGNILKKAALENIIFV